ncbi:MAG: PAS domain-containing sensor histidine kinase [Gammaproteobacteria bacterium]
MSRRFELIVGFAVAVAAVLAIALLRISLSPWLGHDAPLMLFIVAVVAAAWVGGLGPGLSATALGGLAGTYWLIVPEGSFEIAAVSDRVRLGLYVLSGIAISALVHARRRALHEARLERRRLEREVTGRERAEAAMRDSEQRFRLMADNAPVLIWMTGTENLGTWFNKPWLDFTGRTMAEELGEGWAENVHPEDAERSLAICVSAFEARRPFMMEFRLRRHDGEYRWVLDNGVPLYAADGTFTGYIGSCIDITDRKRAEEELRKADRRKDAFLATLAHELRNPLAPLRNGLKLLDAARDDPETIYRTRDMMERQVRQMVRLIDDLLDVSRITRDKLELRKERIRLSDVVQSAVETSRPLLQESEHALTVEMPREPYELHADMIRLAQAFMNLLNNAAKYTPPGGRIGLSVEPRGREIEVRVKDSGVGISAEQLPYVFDMFYQVDHSLERAQGGLGIGLTLANRVVRMHGGSIRVHSDGIGRGSEFVVRLPMHPEPAIAPPDLRATGELTAAP